MARAQGARSQLAAAFETTYGTAPAGGYMQMPFASASLGAEQPLLSSELLGYGRDPLAPIKDAVTADGDIVVPIDAEAFGFWLKAAFGAPTTTGTTNKTHTFTSGIRCGGTRSRRCGRRCRSRGQPRDRLPCAASGVWLLRCSGWQGSSVFLQSGNLLDVRIARHRSVINSNRQIFCLFSIF